MADRLHEHGSRNKVSMMFRKGSREERKYILGLTAKGVCTVWFLRNFLASVCFGETKRRFRPDVE